MAKRLKTTNCNQHRGRIQAQGGGVEESEAWAQSYVPKKSDGYGMAESLKGKLKKKELKKRERSFKKLDKFIENAPRTGYDYSSQSYMPFPPNGDVRVDVEIIKGKAFKDNQ